MAAFEGQLTEYRMRRWQACQSQVSNSNPISLCVTSAASSELCSAPLGLMNCQCPQLLSDKETYHHTADTVALWVAVSYDVKLSSGALLWSLEGGSSRGEAGTLQPGAEDIFLQHVEAFSAQNQARLFYMTDRTSYVFAISASYAM